MTARVSLLLAVLCCAGACGVTADTCHDGRVDGLETDLDCGGTQCGPCGTDLICLFDADCQSGLCALNHCAAPSCHDGVMNGDERGVDCGGACVACVGTGACSDGARGGAETDVDCGGGLCAACADGKSCLRNTDCQSGSCFDGLCEDPCGAPLKACAGACVDVGIEQNNCGACGVSCAPSQACISGQCQVVCGGGSLLCGPGCIDPASNPAHCGGCNQPCSGGQICFGGACIFPCPAGEVVCGGACVSTMRDGQNCGGCNLPCGAGMGCVNGHCEVGCQAPLSVCSNGAVCSDTQVDPSHCGGCPTNCPVLPNAPRTCVSGACVLGQCFGGFADCNTNPADGCETDLGLSASCGSCGRACQGAEFCNLGRCCTGLPAGTYQTTCQGCEACEGQLTCLCKDAAQNLQPASIPLGPCPGGFTNCDGVLLCNGC